MLAELLAFGIMRAEAALTVACALVLLLRRPVRIRFGAEPAYQLWTLVPVAGLASIFPCLSSFAAQGGGASPGWQQWAEASFSRQPSGAILMIWVTGVLISALLVTVGEIRFRRRARRGLAGPAVVGVICPRVRLPSDFQARFTTEQQRMVRAHERAHIERGDPAANLLIVALQMFAWCNPLAYVAAACARFDQELACDARVTEWRPQIRRIYAEALLAAQVRSTRAPLACGLLGSQGGHPLEVRVDMLRRGELSQRLRTRGWLLVSGATLAATVAVFLIAPHSPLLQPH